MNKKGFLTTLLLVVLLVLVVAGFIVYYQIKSHGVEIKSGNIVVDVKYQENSSESNEKETEKELIIIDNFDDLTYNQNISFTNLSSKNQSNQTNLTNQSVN